MIIAMKNYQYDETDNQKLNLPFYNNNNIKIIVNVIIITFSILYNSLIIIFIESLLKNIKNKVKYFSLKLEISKDTIIRTKKITASMNLLNKTSLLGGGRKHNSTTDCSLLKFYENVKTSGNLTTFLPTQFTKSKTISNSFLAKGTETTTTTGNKFTTATTIIPKNSTQSNNFLCEYFSNENYTEKHNNFHINQTQLTSLKYLTEIEENVEQKTEQLQQEEKIEGGIITSNNEEAIADNDHQREQQLLEEDELEQNLQLENSFHTIVLDNSLNDDFNDDDNIDDLTVFEMTNNNMENYLSTINTNNYLYNNDNNKNNSINNNNNTIYDTTTFLPYLNSTSSSSSSASSSLQSISISPSLQSSQSLNDLFEITVNTSYSINFTIANITSYTTSATTTTTTTTTINDLNFYYKDQLNWRNLCLLTIFFTFIVITIIGNTLVILAVVTTRRLRTVTNCFVMSLAVADLLVGIFVMPPAVAVHIFDSWPLGWVLCDIYISLDVLLCTASILSLCAISVDRYLAVTQPLTYSRKRRSKRLALIMILIVWLLALAITCPPILGWYEQGRRDLTYCRYNQNEGYVIFSAMGSFFIPMTVMIYVYARISCVVASRHENMTDIINNKKSKKTLTLDTEGEIDQISSEQDDRSPSQKKQAAARTLSTQTISRDINDVMLTTNDSDNTVRHSNKKNGSSYELIPTSRTPSFKRQSILCGSKNYHQTTTISSSSSDNKSGCASATSDQQHHHHHHHHHHHQQQQQQQQQQQHWANYGRHSVRMHNTTLIIGGGSESYITRNTRVHHQKSLSNRITSLNKENKTTQTLSIVVGGFIVCWLPFFLNYIIAPFLSKEQKNPSLDEFLTWLGWFNSAVNPFIYAFYSVDFRAAFWRLTLKRFYRNPTKNQFPSNTMSIRR